MYTALVLHEEEQRKLLERFRPLIPLEWKEFCHHMTINMGAADNGPAAHLVGQECEVIVRTLGVDERVIAVGVESDVPSTNAVKHITVAVNIDQGGKPKHSNDLVHWTPLLEALVLKGKVIQVG
jgi:hypothetical protein